MGNVKLNCKSGKIKIISFNEQEQLQCFEVRDKQCFKFTNAYQDKLHFEDTKREFFNIDISHLIYQNLHKINIPTKHENCKQILR